MFINVDWYVSFLKKTNLTQNQFLFLYCLKKKKYNAIEIYKETFPTGDGSMIGEANKQDLIDRGFIQKIGESSLATDYEITDKFNSIFLANHFMAADEVWSAYPGYVRIDGENKPLCNMDRYQFANTYAERIGYDVNEHKEVMNDVMFGRTHNLLVTTIEKFVHSEGWKKIREIRLGEQKVQEVHDLNQF